MQVHNWCHQCGKVWWEGQPGDGWLFIEISRGPGDWEDADYVDAMFCSQEHASEWFLLPLPEPEPSVPYRLTWLERLTGLAFASAVGSVVALACLGLLTAVRFLAQHP